MSRRLLWLLTAMAVNLILWAIFWTILLGWIMSDFRVGDTVSAESSIFKVENGVVTRARWMVYVDDYPFRRSQITLLKKAEICQPQYNDHFVQCDLSTIFLLDHILIINEFLKIMVQQEI